MEGVKLLDAFAEEQAYCAKKTEEAEARLKEFTALLERHRDHKDDDYSEELRDEARMFESAQKIQAVERGKKTRKAAETSKQDKLIVTAAQEFYVEPIVDEEC